ncbi:hypothetical protein O3Q52_28460 [Streptomyces sp. ActVer]|uniref:hypothetical protein n=1 Tax=Streptomyces sp. ActVer TaxID=3014558 RepID=UPI0022B5CEFC|nr:hypothetical protein [Streptomyces sp. ActVer]MCZ4512041.1 hypothetical protein [Streptomyces sp. ActVer]
MASPPPAPIPPSVWLKLLTTGRFVVASHLATPGAIAQVFGMEMRGSPAVAYGRMFAIRNAALGLGLLRLDTVTNPRAYLKLNVVVDAVDAVALVASGIRRDIAPRTSVLAAAVAMSAVVAGVGALRAQPEP